MKYFRCVAASLIGLGALAFAPAALADHDRDQDHKDAKDAKKELKEGRKELKDALHDGGAGTPAAKEAREKLKEGREKLKESRDERRKAKRAELEKKYGDVLGKPAVKTELRVHARRMARLHRMESVAKAHGKEAVSSRVQALIDKENARHDKHMTTLKASGGEESK